jgi:hypothetical protein
MARLWSVQAPRDTGTQSISLDTGRRVWLDWVLSGGMHVADGVSADGSDRIWLRVSSGSVNQAFIWNATNGMRSCTTGLSSTIIGLELTG